jgi:hypothetical protein
MPEPCGCMLAIVRDPSGWSRWYHLLNATSCESRWCTSHSTTTFSPQAVSRSASAAGGFVLGKGIAHKSNGCRCAERGNPQGTNDFSRTDLWMQKWYADDCTNDSSCSPHANHPRTARSPTPGRVIEYCELNHRRLRSTQKEATHENCADKNRSIRDRSPCNP